ncbi:MAG: hypothetical protein ACPG3U_05610, partial [Rhodothermales bacterium]
PRVFDPTLTIHPPQVTSQSQPGLPSTRGRNRGMIAMKMNDTGGSDACFALGTRMPDRHACGRTDDLFLGDL